MDIDDDGDGLRKEERKNNVAFSISNTNSFGKLREVRISGCDVLKTVFPASVARSLSQLERLEISECKEIVSVVEEEAEINSKFVFPRLIHLRLEELPKFQAFFFGRYTAECSTSLFEKIGHQVFPKLEDLSLEGKSISLIWEFSEDFICNLRHLGIILNKSIAISSFDFLQRLHSIKQIQIGEEDYWERLEMCQNETWIMIHCLNECVDLKCILKEESNMDHLVHLKVRDCANLVNLFVPSSTSFQNLTTLDVRYCKGLTNIITSSTAKTMGQLTKMTIWGCNMITELVLADEGDETKDYEIVFRELKELYLFYLQNLTGFCSSNYILIFPSLEELTVEECPKLKSFSGGKLSTPKLEKVKYGGDEQFGECWKGDLNTTIEQLYEEMCKRRERIMIELTNEEKEEVIEEEKVVAISSDV